MAVVGTVSGFVFDQYRNGICTITGINAAGNTPLIRTWGFVSGCWQTTGLAASGLTAGVWGSNDGVNIYALNPGTTVDGVFALTTGGTGDGGANIIPLFYTWDITGTPLGPSATIIVTIMSTFG